MKDEGKVRVEPTLGGSGVDSAALPSLEEVLPTPMESRFVLGSRLGRGGMGEVFAAHDDLLNRRLAVKVLHDSTDAGDTLPRFLREAQVTSQLTHPNVVPVYGLERTRAGSPALSMKLIQGQTFGEYMQTCRAAAASGEVDEAVLGRATRIEHFLKVCDAMAYAHDRGVLHRDLKPGNLMLGPFGEVYVMDWGIARVEGAPDLDDTGVWTALAEAAGEEDASPADLEGSVHVSGTLGTAGPMTQAGDILGTFGYMAPEQAGARPEEMGPAADQYSLGIILFELLTLKRARSSKEVVKRYDMAVAGYRRSWEDVGAAELPRELRAVVDKATAPAAGDRYDDVVAFAADLRRHLRGAEVAAAPDGLARKLWRKLRNRPQIVVSTVLSLALLTALAVVGAQARILDMERTSEERRRHLAGLVSLVSGQVQNFDRDLGRVETLLEGVGVATRDLLAHGDVPEPPPRRWSPLDLAEGRGPSDTGVIPRYRQAVTMEAAIVLPPPHLSWDAVAGEQHRLAPMDAVFRAAMLRSAGDELAELQGAEATARLREGVPLMWAYVALEDGTLINFPGNAQYPDDYDASLRPWFKNTLGTWGPHWGALYPDATGTGFLLPCNYVIRSVDGDFLGVAGADLSMNHVIEEMEVPGLEHVRESLLLDAEGGVLVSSAERGLASELSMQGGKTKERRSLSAPGLERQVRSSATSGFSLEGEDLYVFARLKTVPWVLAVRLDALAHGFTP